MRGLFGSKPFVTELRFREDRSLTPNEVRVRVDACGLCGTDLHFLRQMAEPTPLGHEIAGTVEEVGSSISHLRSGDTVIVEDIAVCGHCDQCKRGAVELCSSGPTLNGQPGMSDFLIVDASLCDRYQDMPLLRAAMTEPTAVALRCIKTLAMPSFSSIVIFGMGAIGLLSAAVARLSGYSQIVLVARQQRSKENSRFKTLFESFGIDDAFYTERSDYPEQLIKRYGPFDSALVAAPPFLIPGALELLKPGGRLLAAGVTFGNDSGLCSIDISRLIFEKKSILTSLAEPAIGFPAAIELLEKGRLPAEKLVTHTFELDEHAQLGKWFQTKTEVIKAVLLNRS